MAEPSLYGKLAEVMEAVGYVEKKGRNEFHKYDYVTEADLVEAVRSELSSRRIVMLPSVVKVERDATLTTVHMTFTFIDGETGQKHIAGWSGTGEDQPGKGNSMGDKGLYKAYTGAIKYFLMKSFLIPTGDDPERDDKPVEKAKPAKAEPTPLQVERAEALKARIDSAELDSTLVKNKLVSYRVERLTELNEKDARDFSTWLNAQVEANKAAA